VGTIAVAVAVGGSAVTGTITSRRTMPIEQAVSNGQTSSKYSVFLNISLSPQGLTISTVG
jgi:hypothetical protein